MPIYFLIYLHSAILKNIQINVSEKSKRINHSSERNNKAPHRIDRIKRNNSIEPLNVDRFSNAA